MSGQTTRGETRGARSGGLTGVSEITAISPTTTISHMNTIISEATPPLPLPFNVTTQRFHNPAKEIQDRLHFFIYRISLQCSFLTASIWQSPSVLRFYLLKRAIGSKVVRLFFFTFLTSFFYYIYITVGTFRQGKFTWKLNN